MLVCMRTTLAIDDDVAALLERVRKKRKGSLKSVINAALREGLLRLSQPAAPRRPFRTQAVSLGRCYVPSLDSLADVLAVSEGENFR